MAALVFLCVLVMLFMVTSQGPISTPNPSCYNESVYAADGHRLSIVQYNSPTQANAVKSCCPTWRIVEPRRPLEKILDEWYTKNGGAEKELKFWIGLRRSNGTDEHSWRWMSDRAMLNMEAVGAKWASQSTTETTSHPGTVSTSRTTSAHGMVNTSRTNNTQGTVATGNTTSAQKPTKAPEGQCVFASAKKETQWSLIFQASACDAVPKQVMHVVCEPTALDATTSRRWTRHTPVPPGIKGPPETGDQKPGASSDQWKWALMGAGIAVLVMGTIIVIVAVILIRRRRRRQREISALHAKVYRGDSIDSAMTSQGSSDGSLSSIGAFIDDTRVTYIDPKKKKLPKGPTRFIKKKVHVSKKSRMRSVAVSKKKPVNR